MLIYCITNKINGKEYIGQTTKTLEKRWKMHISESRTTKGGFLLHKAIRKYGIENFTIEIIAIVTSIEELNDLETLFIKLFNTLSPSGYNLKEGGMGSRLSIETRQKIGNSKRGKKLTAEHKAKINPKGRKHSEKTKLKMGLSRKGKKHTIETKNLLSNIRKGKKFKPHSEESKLKMSIAQKGKPKSPEHIANMKGMFEKGNKPWNTGKSLPLEVKEKISATLTGRKLPESTKEKMRLAKKKNANK